MSTLSEGLYAKIQTLSAEGDAFVDIGEHTQAVEKYREAVTLLPPPKEDWEAWTWLYCAMGDAYFFNQNWDSCYDSFQQALKGPDALGNPYIHLRLGQSALEIGEEPRATDELLRAYMGAGLEIFEQEEGKYLEFLQTKVNI
jgi:tetratricopeptide (TPR) repeat protein